MAEAIAAALYRTPHDLAAMFEAYYDPISLETLAMIVTMVRGTLIL